MALEMKCPECGGSLERRFFKDKISFSCRTCGGSLVAVGVLRSLCRSKEFVNSLWKISASAPLAPGKKCPCCNQTMRRCCLAGDNGAVTLELDLCRACQMVWFDPGELSQIALTEAQQMKLPPRAREIMAEYQVKKIAAAEAGRTIGYGIEDDEPLQPWKWLPGLLGLPVEMEEESTWSSIPFVMLSALALCLVVFLFTAGNLAQVIQKYGFIPAQPFREYGATLFSSMFLHGSVWHLVGNLYFLFVFGDDVELELGKLKMMYLLFLSGFSALFFHWLCGSASTIPCVGASGFISGIIAFYAVTFPWRRVGFCFRNRWYGGFGWISYPAWLLFAVWCVFQIIMAMIAAKAETSGGVAYSAHLGGAIPGVVWGVLQRLSSRWKEQGGVPL
ncbi:MAG: rhomboid family intramembrane serine protease [Lentisphaeria bacterium]|nr:rhomboid family intramembrane serine protease [Lentisphaeria bacterium]